MLMGAGPVLSERGRGWKVHPSSCSCDGPSASQDSHLRTFAASGDFQTTSG